MKKQKLLVDYIVLVSGMTVMWDKAARTKCVKAQKRGDEIYLEASQLVWTNEQREDLRRMRAESRVEL